MSTASTPVTYAVWNPPNAAFPIRYPLSLFRDIEFFIGDAYRRIPYGGLEVGAVLYGRGEPSGLTILAYQPIECQHSMGPSFVLSAFDLELLAKQIETPMMNEEGEVLEVVGWLVSNCRSELVLTEQESRIFDEFFPGPRQVTMLAKPEKMKPTRYGFLERPLRGRQFEKACQDSFILPLSSKGEPTGLPEKTDGISGTARSSTYTPSLRLDSLANVLDPRVIAPITPKAVVPRAVETALAAPLPAIVPAEKPLVPPPTPAPEPRTPPPPAATIPEAEIAPRPEGFTQQVSVPASPPVVEDLPVPDPPVAPSIPAPVSAPTEPEVRPAASTAPAIWQLPAQAAESAVASYPDRSNARVAVAVPSLSDSDSELDEQSEGIHGRRRRRRSRVSTVNVEWGSVRETAWQVAILLLLAFAATWTYLRIQRTPIPLNARVRSGQVVVSWPPAFTANATQASMTIWTNGRPAAHNLLLGEQTEGKATILVGGPDVIIQLHVPRWYGDWTGQIRVLRVLPPPPPAAPPKPARRFAPFFRDNVAPPPLVGQPVGPPPATPPQ
jgi:hypothetical protein